MSQPPELLEMGVQPEDEAPRHGFQGDRGAVPPRSVSPSLSIALSRESGARGGTIARRVATRLGWQFYDQDLMLYMANDAAVRQGVLDGLTPTAAAWVEARLVQLRRETNLAGDGAIENLVRLVLALGAVGEAVLVGRGTGYILPRETTLNVRVVSPLPARIAYMAQWLRLPVEEATERVRVLDERRGAFLQAHFNRTSGDVHQYDMVLNSGWLGEEGCADLIVQAAQVRMTALIEAGRA
jgi:cytidylate kinase